MINFEKNCIILVLPVAVSYDNGIMWNHVECGTSSMPGVTRICLKTESNLNCQRDIPSNISVFAEDNVAKHEDFNCEEKSFKCNVYEKTYCQKSDLSTHQRTHTGEKPFECDICEKCFI